MLKGEVFATKSTLVLFPNPHVWIFRQDEADKSKADRAKQSVTKKGKLPKAPTAAAVSVAGPSLLNTTVTVHPTQEANTQMAPVC